MIYVVVKDSRRQVITKAKMQTHICINSEQLVKLELEDIDKGIFLVYEGIYSTPPKKISNLIKIKITVTSRLKICK